MQDMAHEPLDGRRDWTDGAGVALLTLCPEGLAVARRIRAVLPQAEIHLHEAVPARSDEGSFSQVVARTAELWQRCRGLVFILPTGVAVRAIASHVAGKRSDPAVLAIDVQGRWVVSLLAGHEGGANGLSYVISEILDATAMVSTTTEAVRTLVMGLGARRDISLDAVREAALEGLKGVGRNPQDLRLLATGEPKRSEAALHALAKEWSVPLVIIPSGRIRTFGGAFAASSWVQENVGLPAVAEPAAMLAAIRPKLILPRLAHNGVTVAIVEEQLPGAERDQALQTQVQ